VCVCVCVCVCRAGPLPPPCHSPPVLLHSAHLLQRALALGGRQLHPFWGLLLALHGPGKVAVISNGRRGSVLADMGEDKVVGDLG
jgi:hypothetical protein